MIIVCTFFSSGLFWTGDKNHTNISEDLDQEWHGLYDSHVITVCLPSQSACTQKVQSREKTHKPLCTLWIFKKNVCHTVFDNNTILLFWPHKQTFHMFSLHGLHLMHCSLELDVPRVQRSIILFYRNYQQINKVGKSDRMALRIGGRVENMTLHSGCGRVKNSPNFFIFFDIWHTVCSSLVGRHNDTRDMVPWNEWQVITKQ